MIRRSALALPFLALAGTLAITPVPAAAQAIERYVEVYGTDACPPSSDDEIVICARKPEGDRYRIPERLRGTTQTPNSATWGQRAKSIEYVGASGAQSCSAAGTESWTGCWSKLMRQAREERAAQATEQRDLP